MNRTAAGSTLAQRVLFSAHLQTRLPAGSLLDYPDKDPDTSAEAATLRLLYAEQPVRAIGRGVDAVATTTADADTVTTDSFPVAKVTATTADISGPDGPLVVDDGRPRDDDHRRHGDRRADAHRLPHVDRGTD